MKSLAYALGALALATAAAHADPVTPSTITGYAASVAVSRGLPLDGSANAAVNHRAPQFRQSAVQTKPRPIAYTSMERSVRAQ